jgi:hypothetical protein
MLNTKMKMTYKAFGFNVSSDIALPELQAVSEGVDSIDISIEAGAVSQLWEDSVKLNPYTSVSEYMVMFYIPETAIYAIRNGKEIIYTPLEGSCDDANRLYLLGSCMGALLMQRGILPLHGSAIEIDGKAYAIVGDSGAGKSTLASAFLREGYRLISDDVIPVTMCDGVPMVTPAYPQQKLWLESLNHFGMESEGLRPIIDRETKFAIPVQSQFVSKSLPLAGVFELVKTENDHLEFLPVTNLQRLHTLFCHTYRNFLIGPMGLMEWHFNLIAGFVNKIELFQIRRPITHFTAREIASLILSEVHNEPRKKVADR